MFLKNKPGWFYTMNDHISSLQSGIYCGIPWIFRVFAENHEASKNVAAKALSAALSKMAFGDLVRIDEQMRKTAPKEWVLDWQKYSIENFFTSNMSDDERRAVIVFASFNPNGYIRERAVRMMKYYAGTLPFAILRQNDWVSRVREAACETVDYRLSRLSANELISALPFADKLSRSGRLPGNDKYVSRIYAALAMPENEYELITGLNTGNIRTRRLCTNALFNVEVPRYDLAFNRLVHETDPFLRSMVFRRLIEAGQNMDTVADLFLFRDKYPVIRLLAFQYACNNNHKKVLQITQFLLLDKSAAVRENVRFYLKSQNFNIDYRVFYISHLTSCTVPAIYGLGETGSAKDAAEIEGYLNAAQISVVRAAMTSVMRLAGNKYSAAIIEFLADDRDGIVKTARNLIIKTAWINYSRIMEIFRATPCESTKQKCFSILLTASKWQRLIFTLEVLENGGESIAKSAVTALRKWIVSYNRSHNAAPSETQVNQIKQILENIRFLRNKLSANMQRELQFLLK